MKKFTFIFFLILFISCNSSNENLPANGTLLITCNIEFCEFWIFNQNEALIFNQVFDKSESRFISVPIDSKGIYIINAQYYNKFVNDSILFKGGMLEYCIEF